jgi:hypothetical protein
LTSPLSTALTTLEIMEAGFFTIMASVEHSLKKVVNKYKRKYPEREW